ncbi:MAG: L-threonylcarbamoyladenylate synthase [Thaumarchaeota archaeon]|nr:L-threonylcarbamoyladenylate synthase [Nitrososphaerota archaeon]
MSAPVVADDPASIARASSIVMAGGLVVFPTDTVYGLGCDPFNEQSVRKLFDAKGREAKPIPLLCASLEESVAVVNFGPKALQLARLFWPGPLTIVAPLRVRVPDLLHQGTGTLGVRIPASRTTLDLIKSCGGYLTGTSANRSGRPSSRTAREALEQLGDSVQLILDGGTLQGLESTVVKVVGDDLIILRQGPVGVPDTMMKG